MRLFFGGAEVPSHRKYLIANQVPDVYLSYMGLRRRTQFTRPWLIQDKFPDDMNVMLDAGAFTVNKGVDNDLGASELASIATGYEAFVDANAGRVHSFTEFDALPLGVAWINQRRDDFYQRYGDAVVYVWHAEWGVDELERMAAKYRRIGILQTALGDRDLIPVLNMLADKRGTLLHGLAMTKKEVMRDVKWDSVGSTSWTSPMRFGDTFVWTGGELKRYTKPYKEQSRKRHRTLFATHGFDYERIMADDSEEIARLSLWSWREFVADINAHQKRGAVAGIPPADHSAAVAVPTPTRREHIMLPGVSLKQNENEERTEIGIRAENLRRCDTCFLASRGCPGFQAGAECVYELPIYIKTREDIKDVENALISMQTQRVMFMRMVEDIEGGFADPNLSNEIDRLTRMIKSQRDGTADKFSLNISGTQQPGQESPLKMFGAKVIEAQGIEGPRIVDKLVEQTEIFDAEVVNDKEAEPGTRA